MDTFFRLNYCNKKLFDRLRYVEKSIVRMSDHLFNAIFPVYACVCMWNKRALLFIEIMALFSVHSVEYQIIFF